MVVPVSNSTPFDSKSEAPALFDGTTRLYISTLCPYAQRVWTAVNFKGLSDIQIVDISLVDKPTWYVEKVYPVGKVPSLEHEKKVIGESLDLLQYLDDHFDGPRLVPQDPIKKGLSEEILKQDLFPLYKLLAKEDVTTAEVDEYLRGGVFGYYEAALAKFADEGPFFLGKYSSVDVALAPFIDRFVILFKKLKNHDVSVGYPNLIKWLEAVNGEQAYAQTKVEDDVIVKATVVMLERIRKTLPNN